MPPRKAGQLPLDEITVDTTPPNPEAAQDALHIPPTEPEASPPPEAAPVRPRRKTKGELEAETTRLAAELKAAQEKATATAPDMLAASRNAMKATLTGGFGMAAMIRDEEHWRLSEQEANLLADAWAPCIAMALGQHPEIVLWAAALGVTYTAIAPRVMVSRAKEKAAQLAAPSSTSMEATT